MNWLFDHGATTQPAWPLVVVCCVAVFLFASPADASRDLPDSLHPTFDGPVSNAADLDRDLPVRPVLPFFSAADIAALSAGLTYDYDGPDQLLSLTSGSSSVGHHLFQGLWTDPVTGISYARNRWYDARTASWLSEDPKGAVDSPNLYAFVGWGPHVGRDPLGEKTILLLGRSTIAMMPQILLTSAEEDQQKVDIDVIASRVENAVGRYWGTQVFEGKKVLFGVSILKEHGSIRRNNLIRQAKGIPGSYPYYRRVYVIPEKPGTARSTAGHLWTGATNATYAHEAGHWMDWSLAIDGARYIEGYLMPDDQYPQDGAMENKLDAKRVSEIDVGAVLVNQGMTITEYNGTEIKAGYRSVSRDSEDRIRNDLLVERFDVWTNKKRLVGYLQRQHSAINAAGKKTKYSFQEILNRFNRAYIGSQNEEELMKELMQVISMVSETTK